MRLRNRAPLPVYRFGVIKAAVGKDVLNFSLQDGVFRLGVTGQMILLVAAMRGLLTAFTLLVLIVSVCNVAAQEKAPVRIAVLDFGETSTGRTAAQVFSRVITSEGNTTLIDRDLVRTAARGTGYSNSLNLSLQEARDLGAAIGCDFYLLGDAQTLRRSPSMGAPYFEAYASVFLVSSRTGRLILWERPSFQAISSEAAEKLLLAEVASGSLKQHYLRAMRTALENERHERELSSEHTTLVIEDAPDQAEADAPSLRLPRPYRRLKPQYPDSAARAGAEATVDVLVELDKQGEVTNVEVARWAGFGLDEATVNTVRQLHFFPAMRDGSPIPIRILLRYNFRQSANN